MSFHGDLVGEELHVPGYVQSGDPGAVGAGMLWVDTSGGAGSYILKIRNSSDSGWNTAAAASVHYHDSRYYTETEVDALLAAQTHVEADITDLQDYLTEADADLLYSILAHTHLEADVTDLDHDAAKIQGDDIYASITPTDGQHLEWDDGNSRWDAQDPPENGEDDIFFGSSTTGQKVIGSGANDVVDWQETAGYRKDSGFTHDTGTDPSEITLDVQGAYLIHLNLGFDDSAADGYTTYIAIIEAWTGSSWEDIANDGASESGASTFTHGGSAPEKSSLASMNFYESPAASRKIRVRLQVSSTAGTPNASLNDEECRIYIEKKTGG